MTEHDKLIDKVRKLLAKANDPSVTTEEAASYAAKAAQLLQQHNLDSSLLSEKERSEGFVIELWNQTQATNVWKKFVVYSAARVYMCKAVESKRWEWVVDRKTKLKKPVLKACWEFVGRPHNIEVLKEMVEYLTKTTVRLGLQYSKSIGRPTPEVRWAFEKGCGLTISQRLDEMYQEATRVKKGSDGSGLPALYSTELTLVNDWAQENMKIKSTDFTMKRYDDEANAAGEEAGRKVSLNAQLKADTKSSYLLS